MKKLIIGILVSSIFIYLSFNGVKFDKILTGFNNANYIYLIPTLVLFILASFLRSLRWGAVLSPMVKISQRRLFPIVCVGQMGITLIPMRIGELIKPYLVSNESKLPFNSALATILLERVFDIFTLLGISFLIIFISVLPEGLIKTRNSALIILVVLIFFITLSYFKKEATLRFFKLLFNKLPQRIQAKIENLVHSFVDGFKIISSPKMLVYTLLLSCLIWGCAGLGTFTLFFFYNFQLSFVSAFVILFSTVIGVSLPTAPGMLGNFHFSCIAALLFFNIPKSDALSFSLIYYFMAIGRHILLGLIFLPFVNLSFRDVKRQYNVG
ncbi:MAG: lysylphosphatidylglycerol synthase transmembrane domain-containing protein [Thermodesulfobacteriota bacterium]|nr:lysylphosphatidylglycerol synthase transmembrane domain-containing protein [Thermodesulfobacteriota bacterium]